MTGLGETLWRTGKGCHSTFVPPNCLYVLFCRSISASTHLQQQYSGHCPCSSSTLARSSISLSSLFVPLFCVILLAIFSRLTFFFPSSSSHRQTAPSRGATQPCSNCFLQLHWAIETEWPLMLNSPQKDTE